MNNYYITKWGPSLYDQSSSSLVTICLFFSTLFRNLSIKTKTMLIVILRVSFILCPRQRQLKHEIKYISSRTLYCKNNCFVEVTLNDLHASSVVELAARLKYVIMSELISKQKLRCVSFFLVSRLCFLII